MSDKELLYAYSQLAIAVKALEKICYIDGLGADLSPPGPCYSVAKEALDKLDWMTPGNE